MAPEFEIRVLGPLEFSSDGRPVPIRRGHPRALLLALLIRAGQGVTVDALIDDVWEDDPPRRAVNSVQILVSYLRKVLQDEPAAPRIETLDGAYRLVVHPDGVDAFAFEHLVTSIEDLSDPARRLAAAEEALGLWRGAPFGELSYKSFAQPEIRRLQERRLLALEHRAQALLDLGRPREAVTTLQALVSEHPHHERFHAQLMVGLYRSSRQAEALRAYDAARRLLGEELGIDPSPDLQALAHAVLIQDPALELRPPIERTEATLLPSTAGCPRPHDALPPRTGRLVGRDPARRTLTALLRERRIITVTGPAGSGKSRLAAEVAHDLIDQGETVWWVDLASTTSGSDVVAAVATALGAPATPGSFSDLAAQVASRSGILVLDTCDRVAEEVRALVDCIRRSTAMMVLSTSRKALCTFVDHTFPVPPLELPAPGAVDVADIEPSAAVQLFVERASAARADFALTPQNAQHVSEAVQLLDGLPLAIELATACADWAMPARIVDLLRQRRLGLADERRDPRQRSLQATIDWSYDLLDPDEALFFERLSVFEDRFTAETAGFVAGDGLSSDAFDVLVSLLRQSLVVTDGDDAFALLGTFREYAARKLLARGRRSVAELRLRHAAWCSGARSSAVVLGPPLAGATATG